MATRRTLDCHERALRLLAVRPRSRRELEMGLRRAGFEAGEVETELVRLEDVGLVDDEAFARDLAEHHLAVRRSGRRAVESALAAKGVPRQTIQRALEGQDQDESARAGALAADRARRLSSLPPETAYRRLVAFLARRGYQGGVARDAARTALRLDPGAE
jgi:regulatory protein